MAGILIQQVDWIEGVYYGFGWTSTKQKQISYSYFGAEIIDAVDVYKRGFNLRETIRKIFPLCHIIHEMIVDSNDLFKSTTTLHESREYRLKRPVSRIRHAFKSRELDVVRWFPGWENVAEAVTKSNEVLGLKLNDFISTGVWDVDMGWENQTRGLWGFE